VGIQELAQILDKRATDSRNRKSRQEYEPVDDEFATVADIFRAVNNIWIGHLRFFGQGSPLGDLALQSAAETRAMYDTWSHTFLPCDAPDKEYCVVCGSGSSPATNAIVFCPKCGCGRH